jgi:Gnt-I system high-affinity gluconate transporter
MVWPLEGKIAEIFSFIAEPSIVMLIALSFATFALGIGSGMSMKKVMDIYVEAVKDVSIILLIVSGAGALKQVFTESGVSGQIAVMLQGWTINPFVLGWMIAAIIRVAMGSATVAGLTTAGIIAPVIAQTGADPNLMVLSIGAGSLMFSHVNDAGFWLFKEYFNLSIKDTIRSWSIMESIVSVVGLCGVLILDILI